MRLVLANFSMVGVGGSETFLLTIAEQLLSLGHEPLIYTRERGPFSDFVEERGVKVIVADRALPDSCDVVIAQDAPVSYHLAERYPDAVHIFRACNDLLDFELPPQLERVVDQIVVASDRIAERVKACAQCPGVLRLRQPIDIKRLAPPEPIRERPRLAVLLGNYNADERQRSLEAAWGPKGVEVRRVGGSAGQRYDVAQALMDADIVVGKARAAIDGMACGRAVYVFDEFGLDGWVTEESYPALEADNFLGLATPQVASPALLERDLDSYEQRMGAVNRDLVLQHHSASSQVAVLLDAIKGLQQSSPSPTTRSSRERQEAPLRELSRLAAMNWSWEREATLLRTHVSGLNELQRRFERELEQARERLSESEGRLAAAQGELASARQELEHRRAGASGTLVGGALRRLRSRAGS